MVSVISVLSTLVAAVLVGFLILKKYNPVFVFFGSGIVMLFAVWAFGGNPAVIASQSNGNVIFDIFGFITQTFKANISGVGLVIMIVAGFAEYMNHIEASGKLAYVANKPLSKIKNKYLILSGTFVVGMILKFVITSYAGLMILLLAAIYPVLIALKIRPITAASVLSLIVIDYGPNDASTVQLTEMADMGDNVVEMFLNYQIYTAVCCIVVMALIIPIYYRFMDKMDEKKGIVDNTSTENLSISNPNCPTYYILLPWLPIIFLFGTYILGLLGYSLNLDIVSANLLSIAIVFILQYAQHRNAKKIGEDTMVILKAMGSIFATVVSLLIAATVFAEGIKSLKGIEIMVLSMSGMGNAATILIIVVLSFIVYIATTIMGSGNASMIAFGKLAGDIAHKLGLPPVSLVLPVEIAASLGRANSPIAGGVLVLAGFCKVEPMALVKRSTPILLIGMIVNIAIAYCFAI